MLVEPETRASVAAAQSTPRSHASSGARTESIRSALLSQHADLKNEQAALLSRMEINNSVDAGDDAADLGTKAFAREQELVIVSGIQSRIAQVERALAQLESGRYGWCERCAEEIPVARLAAFPSATQCVRCKELEERR